jgi:hypothetical protein
MKMLLLVVAVVIAVVVSGGNQVREAFNTRPGGFALGLGLFVLTVWLITGKK